MTFIIPKGGKMLHVGKRLVSLKEGEFDTSDKEAIETLKGARGVTVKTSKSKTPS